MAITVAHTIRDTEPCVVTAEPRVRGDMGENGKDDLVWEFANYDNGVEYIGIRSKGVTRGLVLGLV